MIESKELRIGNLIYDDEGLICTVTGLSPHEHLVRCDTEEGCQIMIDFIDIDGSVVTGYVLGSDSAYAIPLTEEWLVKLGFVLWGDGLGEQYWITTDFWISLDYFFRWGEGSIEIKYVHQLQNLYFALTGEELTIEDVSSLKE